MSVRCVTIEKNYIRLTDETIGHHLQEIIYDIQENTEDTYLLEQQISQLIGLAKLNGWHDTQYFLEMAQNTLITE